MKEALGPDINQRGEFSRGPVMVFDGSRIVGYYEPPISGRAPIFSFTGAVRPVQPEVLESVLTKYKSQIDDALLRGRSG